jgi:flagellar hook-associated protein 2
MSSSITNSNLYNVSSSSSSNGLSGLMSGIDTESMVKKMLSATQAKIDKQNQAKTATEWKQTIYQGVVSDINTFKSKYFDSSYGSTLSTNLASSSFFNSMISSVTSGSSVKVVSSSTSASTEDMSVIVSQLAKAAKIDSQGKMSGTQTITGGAMDVTSIINTINSGKELSLTLSLDGTAKTLTFSKDDFSGTIDASTIKSALDAELTKAFGSYVNATMTADNKLTFSLNLNEAGHELTITGVDAQSFGVTPGASTLISGTTKLGDLTGIQGGTYSFTINGTAFKFSSNDDVSGMIGKINSSDAGVKLSYSSMTDKFEMQTASTGAQYGIDMSQQTGNILSVLFGDTAVAAAPKAANKGSLQMGTVSGTALDSAYKTNGASMNMTVNGKAYTFTLSDNSTAYTKTDVENKLNEWLTSTFGQTSGTSNISYAEGKLTTAVGYAVSFTKTKVNTTDSAAVAAAAKTDLALAFGFSTNGASNAVTGDTNIADVLQLQGLSFLKSDGTTAATTLSDIASYSGVSNGISFADGNLCISGSSNLDLTGTGLESLFGTTVALGTGMTASGAVEAGADALLKINNVDTSRSSNTFTVNGITLTALKVSAEETVIGTTRDIEPIVKAIKSFVTDYNTMINTFYSLMTEDPDYRNYAPLTTAQKADMSDTEITAWEKKAKTGLVRSDSDISSYLSSMRNVMNSTCDKAGIALYSIGIETSAWDLTGQLSIDESALRSAIASNPESVATLFTDSTDGIAKQISTICDNTAKLSVASPGALVALAGAKGWSVNAKSNEMYKQLSDISDKLDDLKDKYDDEKERYWAKFSAMETAMASYSSQSSMLSSMTGS